jgi:hypothetical protein
MTSWDAAFNYCEALKSTIAAGVTVGTINYGSYMTLTKGLADVPTTCTMGNPCSALPNDIQYWLNGLIQWDCDGQNYSTSYGDKSCNAFNLDGGFVGSYPRYGHRDMEFALCE